MTAAPPLPTKCLVEFIGTFFLCFTVATTAGQGAALAGLAIGSSLMCAIYFGGHVSGANYNPAVSLALLVRGALPPLDFGMYVVAQCLGAISAGLAAYPVALSMSWTGTPVAQTGYAVVGHPAIASTDHVASALLDEIILTFALCHVVLHTATTSFAEGKSYYGLAIGFVVVSGAISVGGVSGGAFNPAVSMLTLFAATPGGSLDPSKALFSIWIYWVGPLVGGVLAGGLFRITHPSEVSKSGGGNPAYTDYIIEFVGTFLLSFTVATAAAPSNTSGLAAISIGSMLMVNVYAGGPTSGGHYNPAVTLAAYLRLTAFGGQEGLSMGKAAGYMVTQVVAGLAAGFAGKVGVIGGDIGFPCPKAALGNAWYFEVLATFFLAFVVLQSATAKATAGNSFFGLSIGFTVTAMAVAVGGVSGGALNPAVGFTAIAGSLNSVPAPSSPIAALFGVYCTACFVGGALAACVFRVTNAKEFETGKGATEKTPLTQP